MHGAEYVQRIRKYPVESKSAASARAAMPSGIGNEKRKTASVPNTAPRQTDSDKMRRAALEIRKMSGAESAASTTELFVLPPCLITKETT